MPRRDGWFGRLNHHFHTHPKGRLHEFLFWMGLAAAFGTFAVVGWYAAWISTPIALMIAVVALALAGWSFLPPQRVPQKKQPLSPKSKRKV